MLHYFSNVANQKSYKQGKRSGIYRGLFLQHPLKLLMAPYKYNSEFSNIEFYICYIFFFLLPPTSIRLEFLGFFVFNKRTKKVSVFRTRRLILSQQLNTNHFSYRH